MTNRFNGFSASLLGLPLALLANIAVSDGLPITITNDSTDDVMVTVYDVSTHPRAVVLANTRINGFTTIPVSIPPNATGHMRLSWTAVTADPNSRKCGHADGVEIGSSAALNVHADSQCEA